MRQRCVNNPYQITTVFGNVPGYPLNNGFHTGTDYVSADKYIVAPMNSKVVQKGYDATNGNYLVLEADGYRDWFSHIDRYLVTSGDVRIGQPLAVMGKTGAATGVHVHHSLRVNGELVDPEKHIGGVMDKITKEQEITMSIMQTGSAPGANYDYRFTGKPLTQANLDACLQFWSKQPRPSTTVLKPGIYSVK